MIVGFSRPSNRCPQIHKEKETKIGQKKSRDKGFLSCLEDIKFSENIFVPLTVSRWNVEGRGLRRPPGGQAAAEGPPLQYLYGNS